MTRRWWAIALLALVGASAAACSDDGPGEGEAHLEVDGRATVERSDGDTETVDDGTDLERGDRVTMEEGTAVMELRGGTTFELREGVDEAAPTQVLMGSPPVLEAGELLVTTPESTRVEADGTDVVVRDGAARLTRAFGMSASAYDADLEVDSAGVDTEVRSLRQVAVPDLGRPRPPRPVDYVPADPWDVRYLGAAMALGDQLEKLAEDLTGRLPSNEGRTPGFFKLVLPGLEDEGAFTAELLEELDPELEREQGDTLIGAAITDLGERGSFVDRWGEVFGFRDEGAAWGIVALDQAVQSEPLIGTVENAFDASIDEIALVASADEPSPGAEPDEPGTGGTDEPGGDGQVDGGTDTNDGGSEEPIDPTSPTLPPPLTPPPPSEPSAELEPIDPVVEPVVDLVEGLLGGLT